ncbi:Starch-binding associating with outer membrane [Reichenbachiella faecimaris]|uniref:Starch-binding associating with outer membrane n=1 Tax=Reichenbachiella faecimaris TaxID=692418 RepID=A0A1W2GL46_REIFA|nr:RagB/SusD family nutrient uptake outer membrane protein [Reichenbachiella faecimaris]SMD37365.1 Starch-binding associating with outer membrane [Reichenbachiella faecimaris]
MNKKLAILGMVGLIMTVVVTACSDFLDTDVNGVSSIETFYQTDEDAELAIIATYDILTWHENSWGWASPTFIKTLPSDEGTCGGANDTDQPPYQALDDYEWDATNNALLGTWNVNYYGVFRANMVIENIVPENDLKKRIVAEAKGLRAFFYLELVTQFGDLPLVLTGLTPAEYNQARVPAADIYAQIETDLKEAIPELPTKAQYAAGDKFRVSKGTAYSILGKAQLYQKKYSEAVSSFNNVTGYSLEPNYADIFVESGEFGVESIFEASYSSLGKSNWDNYPWGVRHEDNIHIQLMGPRSGNIDGLGMLGGWGFNYPSTKMAQAFLDEGDTERYNATILSEADYLTISGDTEFDPSAWWDYDGYFRLKYGPYVSETILTDPASTPELNYGTNWRLIRYADILLLLAEAHYFDGNEPAAQAALNEVRDRVGLPDVTVTGNALFNAIVKERQLELAFEGHRYFDLIRWGLADQELGSLGYTSKHSVFPIPASELAAATNMTQNDGY